MASTRKGYKVSATVIPVNDLIPVADSNDIAGNLMYFDNLADINNIPITKRKLGMFVYVGNEGKHYKLIDNKPVLDNDCWEEYELVNKKYVDDAISAIGTVDLTGYETTEHAEDTYAKKSDIQSLANSTPQIQSKEFNVSQNALPFVSEWEIPTTGPIILQVTKEVEQHETVPSTEVVNEVTFNSANANLVTINGNDQNPALVTVDDNGIRMKDCYVDQAIDLQMFGNSLPTPIQGSPVSFNSQLIITDSKFTFDNLNEFEGLSVTGSVGSNNFVGLVIRTNEYNYGDFGVGIGYDFDEGKWFAGLSDYYNIASWPETKNLPSFDTDFSTTIMNEYNSQQTNYNIDTYVTASIPINKIKDIPANKWQELFNPNGIDLSSKSLEGSGGTYPTLDKSKAQICFVFAAMDESQPCRVTKLGIKKSYTTTNTITKKVPALNPEDFTYDIKTEKGKSAVRFVWSGWQLDMTGRLYCENLYFSISQ